MKICCPSRTLLIAFPIALPVLEVGAACYQLFDEKDKLVIQSADAPVSLSGSLSDNVSASYPRHYLIASTLSPCPEFDDSVRQATIVNLPSEAWNRGPIAVDPERVYDGYYFARSPGATRPVAGAPSGFANARRAGSEIHVRGYTRKDGSHVPAHTRARPSFGSSRR